MDLSLLDTMILLKDFKASSDLDHVRIFGLPALQDDDSTSISIWKCGLQVRTSERRCLINKVENDDHLTPKYLYIIIAL